jgi:hypothetical protein
MTPRKGKPLQGKDGERAMSSAERKLGRGKQSKGKSELPGITVRRGRKEGA